MYRLLALCTHEYAVAPDVGLPWMISAHISIETESPPADHTRQSRWLSLLHHTHHFAETSGVIYSAEPNYTSKVAAVEAVHLRVLKSFVVGVTLCAVLDPRPLSTPSHPRCLSRNIHHTFCAQQASRPLRLNSEPGMLQRTIHAYNTENTVLSLIGRSVFTLYVSCVKMCCTPRPLARSFDGGSVVRCSPFRPRGISCGCVL